MYSNCDIQECFFVNKCDWIVVGKIFTIHSYDGVSKMGKCFRNYLCSRTHYRICVAQLDFSYLYGQMCWGLQISVQYLQINTPRHSVFVFLDERLHCNRQNRRLIVFNSLKSELGMFSSFFFVTLLIWLPAFLHKEKSKRRWMLENSSTEEFLLGWLFLFML